MAGQAYSMIQKIIAQKAKGNAIIASSVRTKMILKGINVEKFTATTPDDPKIVHTLQELAKEYGITL